MKDSITVLHFIFLIPPATALDYPRTVLSLEQHLMILF